MGTFIDLSGQQFGEITVLSKDLKISKEKHKTYWKCQCSCGRIKSIRTDNLKKIQTCGECKKDLTNQRFGRLVAIQKGKKDKAQHQYWICRCDCGNIVEVNSDNLRRKLTQSCGCYHKETISKLLSEDLTNQKFGMLTVIEKTSSIGERTKWLCKCDCGGFIEAQANNLKSGHTVSCGCLTSMGERLIEQILQNNNLVYKKEYSFKDLPKRRFDFAILNSNKELMYLIEFDGKQHFSYVATWHKTKESFIEAQRRDIEKNNYCLIKNIPLIRIPYYSINDITLEDLIPKTSRFILSPDMEEAQEVSE